MDGVNEPSPENIDDAEPGSETRGQDGVATQLEGSDTLDYGGLSDPLDEGWSPPDREPSVHVPTQAEEAAGESLDTLLAAEVPDVGVGEDSNLWDEEGEEVGDLRAGRLVDDESDGFSDVEKSLVAEDVGIDGAAASAEEAAMHVIDPDDDEY